MIQLKALLGNYIFHFEFVTLTSTVGHKWKVLISENLLHDVMHCIPPRRIHVNCHRALPKSWAVCSNEILIADSWFRGTYPMASAFFKEVTPARALNSCLTHWGRDAAVPAALQALHVLCGQDKGHWSHLSPSFPQCLPEPKGNFCLYIKLNCITTSWLSLTFCFPRLQPWKTILWGVFVYKWVISMGLCPLQLASKAEQCVEESVFHLTADSWFPWVRNIAQQAPSFLRLTCGS